MTTSAPSLSALERRSLVEALDAAGPQAPTLCAGWTAHDLAAHLVARERRPDSGPGIMIGALAGWTERVRRGYLNRPFDELIGLIGSGPPRTSLFALPGVDAAVNLAEHFVHAEDVRRAGARWQARELVPGLQDALWQNLSRRGRMMFRRIPVGIELATPDGRSATVRSGPDRIRITGEPAELLLYAFGRRGAAQVQLDGPDEALERLRSANLSI